MRSNSERLCLLKRFPEGGSGSGRSFKNVSRVIPSCSIKGCRMRCFGYRMAVFEAVFRSCEAFRMLQRSCHEFFLSDPHPQTYLFQHLPAKNEKQDNGSNNKPALTESIVQLLRKGSLPWPFMRIACFD